MKYHIFVPILLLQFLNIFLYTLILRIAYRLALFITILWLLKSNALHDSAVTESVATDIRSDDEDEGEDNDDDEKEEWGTAVYTRQYLGYTWVRRSFETDVVRMSCYRSI